MTLFLVTQYYQMPDLFQFDDYQKCMAEAPDEITPAYCIVNTFIKPDRSSQLYSFIHEFSGKEKQHFRHDKLQRGVCVEKCLKLIEELDSEGDHFSTDEFPMDVKLTFDFVQYRFVNDDRLQFNRILNICMNKYLADNYNLSGFSKIEYCLRRDQHIRAGSALIC